MRALAQSMCGKGVSFHVKGRNGSRRDVERASTQQWVAG
jgi:hypothetical protein